MTDPHIAVTGAAGYIGSRILHDLQRIHPDWQVTALDNFYHGEVREIGDVTVEYVDIRHRDRLEDALEGVDVLLHMAALSGVDDCDQNPDRALEVNVLGTTNVAWFCRKTGVGLGFPFSMAVLGDPKTFPITVDLPRNPLNWYGRTKVLGEATIDMLADGAFPAHQFMISNLYGEHRVGNRRVSKGTVMNFFVNRALAGKPLTVYEPGTQARNFVHVNDVARAFVLSAERLLAQRADGTTGTERYEVATDEDPSVMALAELVQRVARDEHGISVTIDRVENPRSGETLVEEFAVDTTETAEHLGWEPQEDIETTIRSLLAEGNDATA